jgi:RNA polymerase sigma-70 factor (ECF subfamily)
MAEIAEDAELVEQFRRGDDTAFDRIVQRYAGQIAAMANRLLGWPGDVDDITQDVFVSAYIGLRKFRGDCSLRSWLFVITINKCRSHRYKTILRLKRFSRPPEAEREIPGRAVDSDLTDAETFERVRRAVRILPPKCREVVVLRYLQELPTDEICRILGISTNALQVRLNRARERLRQQLGELIEE